MITLSKVAVGKPYTRYRSEETPHNELLRILSNSKYDYTTRKYISTGLDHITSSNGGADCYHKNYLEYLERCWADHLGAVFTPDILWYTLLCELALIVAEEPEAHRPLFSTSQEKQDIVVYSDSLTVMPVEELIKALKGKVPTDVDKFLPVFSTTTRSSEFACQAAFCDAVSPYYNYAMYCCAIPVIDVRGTADDYSRIVDHWKHLSKLMPTNKKWFAKTLETLEEIGANLTNVEFWKRMFFLERCGSGSQNEVAGWFSCLMRVQPKYPRMSSNFSTHVSTVKYKQLQIEKSYEMKNGIFSSRVENDLLVPDFGYEVFEVV